MVPAAEIHFVDGNVGHDAIMLGKGVILLVPVQLMDRYKHLDADATALARRP